MPLRKENFFFAIPVKTGIQAPQDFFSEQNEINVFWIPACAGMTDKKRGSSKGKGIFVPTVGEGVDIFYGFDTLNI